MKSWQCTLQQRTYWVYELVNQGQAIHNDHSRVTRGFNSHIGVLQVAIRRPWEHAIVSINVKHFSSTTTITSCWWLHPQWLIGLKDPKQLLHGVRGHLGDDRLIDVGKRRGVERQWGRHGSREEVEIEVEGRRRQRRRKWLMMVACEAASHW